ncbi:MAG: GTP pyrophosphokinase [Bacilli bacterium]
MNIDWEDFLAPYHQAVNELKVKLKAMRSQFERQELHSPIEFVTGRVKPVASILDKLTTRKIPTEQIEEMYDIAGLRLMCQFVDDIPIVVEQLRRRTDFEVVEERDYVSEVKESGYRSYHLHILYPVETLQGPKKVLVEIQIRTLAMNFWATIEHSLNYKYCGDFPEDIKARLQRTAQAAYLLDEEMSKIREEIQEAQAMFSRKREDNRDRK